MGKENKMAKNNRTADRVQAMLNLIGGEDVLEMLMNGRAKLKVEIDPLITTMTSVNVEANAIYPHGFFRGIDEVYTSDDFNDLILSAVSETKVMLDDTILCFADLMHKANDFEICDEFSEGFVFEDVDMFLVRLATLIEGQLGGEKGPLLNNSRTNIFYVREKNGQILTTTVRFNLVNLDWTCHVHRLGDKEWIKGSRVFLATVVQG